MMMMLLNSWNKQIVKRAWFATSTNTSKVAKTVTPSLLENRQSFEQRQKESEMIQGKEFYPMYRHRTGKKPNLEVIPIPKSRREMRHLPIVPSLPRLSNEDDRHILKRVHKVAVEKKKLRKKRVLDWKRGKLTVKQRITQREFKRLELLKPMEEKAKQEGKSWRIAALPIIMRPPVVVKAPELWELEFRKMMKRENILRTLVFPPKLSLEIPEKQKSIVERYDSLPHDKESIEKGAEDYYEGVGHIHLKSLLAARELVVKETNTPLEKLIPTYKVKDGGDGVGKKKSSSSKTDTATTTSNSGHSSSSSSSSNSNNSNSGSSDKKHGNPSTITSEGPAAKQVKQSMESANNVLDDLIHDEETENDEELLQSLNNNGGDAKSSSKKAAISRVPRITEADITGNRQTMHRKLDEPLYLILKDGKTGKWTFSKEDIRNQEKPEKERMFVVRGQLGRGKKILVVETMRDAAKRKAKELFVSSQLKAMYPGMAPIGYHVYAHTTTKESKDEGNFFGSKVFMYRAEVSQGELDANVLKKLGFVDFAWVTKSELFQEGSEYQMSLIDDLFTSKDYVLDMLIDDDSMV